MKTKQAAQQIVFLNINPAFAVAFTTAQALGFEVLNVPSAGVSFEGVIARFAEQIKNRSIVAFWACKDQLLPLMEHLNRKFCPNAVCSSADSIRLTKNKWLMRKALEGFDLNPRYCLIREEKELRIFDQGERVVTKPPLGYSSIGVEKVVVGDGFTAALNRTKSVIPEIQQSIPAWENLVDKMDAQAVLVEEFVAGQEISMDVFATKGQYSLLGTCEKSPMVAPYFEEISYCMPARQLPQPETIIRDKLFCALVALKFHDGVAHCELIVSEERTVLLDVGLRVGGGGLTHDLVYFSSGINLAEALLSQLIGRDPTLHLSKKQQDVCLLYLYRVGCGGRVVEMPKITDPIKTNTIRAVNFISTGDTTTGYPKYSGLPGYALFHVAGQTKESYARVDQILEICGREMQIKYLTRKE